MISREVEQGDFHKGLLDLFSQLTKVKTNMSEQEFNELLLDNNNTITMVIEDCITTRIIATGKIIIEKKLYGSKVGHIEDVVVDENHRKKGLGEIIIKELTEKAKSEKCYKICLDCVEQNVGFYGKCGYKKKGVEMCRYFEENFIGTC